MANLAESRFLVVQTAISTSAAEPVWERWTIDEIDEGIVRVLVCQALDPGGLQRVADDIVSGATEASPESMRQRLHRAAMAVELVAAAEQWTVEGSMFVTAKVLAPFLHDREGKPGLPANRPLREGDVFWILLPYGPALELPPMKGTTLDDGAARIAAYRDRQGDVWDVTAAARQVAKLEHHRALEAGEVSRDVQEGGPEAGAEAARG